MSRAGGTGPRGSALGDWNGDGLLDFALATSGGQVRVYLGTGTTPLSTASFTGPTSISVGNAPFAIIAARINDDPILDLVTANNSNGTVSVLLGNGTGGVGNGTFATPISFSAGARPFDLVAADFNADGRLDLAVSDNDCTNGGVAILLALAPTPTGQPQFAAPVSYPLGCNGALLSTADFNEDGHPDIVVAVTGASKVSKLMGLGGASFTASTLASGLSSVLDALAGDFDNDGITDVASGSASGLTIYWGRGIAGVGDGSFDPGVLVYGGGMQSIAVGDQDGDGDLDIVGAAGLFRLLLQTAPRTFAAAYPSLKSAMSAPKLVDFTHDGRADLLALRTSNGGIDYVQSVCTVPDQPIPDPSVPGWDAQGRLLAASSFNQVLKTMVPDGSGGVFLVWLENSRVRGQHLSSAGARLWGAAGILICASAQAHGSPFAISDGAGGLYVSWLAEPATASLRLRRLKRVDSSGLASAGWPACGVEVGSTSNAEDSPAGMAADDAGGVYVAQPDQQSGSLVRMRVYRFDSSGATAAGWPSGGVLITGGTDFGISYDLPLYIQIVPNGAGGIVCAVTREYFNQDTGGGPPTYATFATQFSVNSTGTVTSGGSFGLALHSQPILVRDPNGGALLGYFSLSGPRVSRLSSMAQSVWDVSVGAGQGSITIPRVAADGGGGAFVLWDAAGSQSADIFGTRLTAAGTIASGWASGPTLLLSQPGDQREGQLVHDGAGGFAVVWRDERFGNRDIYFDRYDGLGQPLAGWPTSGVSLVSLPSPQQAPLLAWIDPAAAIACWDDQRSGVNQIYAQRVQLDQPVAAAASLRSVTATPTRVHVVWQVHETPSALGVERGNSDTWSPVGVPSVTGERFVEWTDDQVVAGTRVRYRLVESDSRVVVPGSEVEVEIPSGLSLALHGFDPNPASSDAMLAFTLPTSAPAKLAMFDVAGRQVLSREVGSLGAGRHRIPLEGERLAPGFYILRLTQGSESRVGRGLVVK